VARSARAPRFRHGRQYFRLARAGRRAVNNLATPAGETEVLAPEFPAAGGRLTRFLRDRKIASSAARGRPP